MSSKQAQIKLNIGGTIFSTTRATLENSTYFRQLIYPRSNTHFNTDGSIFIDRDGTHFRHIINYLRDNTVPSLNASELEQLLTEANFYQLNDLAAALRAKRTGSVSGGRSRKATKRRRRRYK